MSARSSLPMMWMVFASLPLVSALSPAAEQTAPPTAVHGTGPVAQPLAGAAGVVSASPGAVVKRPPSPLMAELMAVLESETQQIEALEVKVAAAPDAMAALAIQRQIEKVKFDTEVSLLRVQATHARRAGRTALADRLDAAVEEMLRPVARGVPIPRSAPTSTAR